MYSRTLLQRGSSVLLPYLGAIFQTGRSDNQHHEVAQQLSPYCRSNTLDTLADLRGEATYLLSLCPSRSNGYLLP